MNVRGTEDVWIRVVAFADDITILAQHPEIVLQMVREIMECLDRVNLKVHPQKSECLWSKHPKGLHNCPIRIDGTEVKISEQVVILGHALA